MSDDVKHELFGEGDTNPKEGDDRSTDAQALASQSDAGSGEESSSEGKEKFVAEQTAIWAAKLLKEGKDVDSLPKDQAYLAAGIKNLWREKAGVSKEADKPIVATQDRKDLSVEQSIEKALLERDLRQTDLSDEEKTRLAGKVAFYRSRGMNALESMQEAIAFCGIKVGSRSKPSTVHTGGTSSSSSSVKAPTMVEFNAAISRGDYALVKKWEDAGVLRGL